MRMLACVRSSWCWLCHARPGLDCPDRGLSRRQQKRREKREWQREIGERP